MSKYAQYAFGFIYGRNLITPSAVAWMVAIFAVVIAMFSLEGFVMYAAMSTILPPDMYIVAILIGIVWSIIIYFADFSLVTFDSSESSKENRRNNRKINLERWTVSSQIFQTIISKFVGAVFWRVVIISITMVITAPLLSRFLDQRPAIQAMEEKNVEKKNSIITAIKNKNNTEANAIQDKLDKDRIDLQAETAGLGLSGQRGCRETCEAIKSRINERQNRLNQTKIENDKYVNRLLEANDREFERLTNQKLLSPDSYTLSDVFFSQRQKTTNLILGFNASDIIASSMLLIIFSILLLLKLLQPKSVEIYFNSMLQSEYSNYVNGGFDHLPVDILKESERHEGVSPLRDMRFEKWFYGKFLPSQKRIEQQSSIRAAHDEIGAELERLKQGREIAMKRSHGLESSLEVAREDKWKLEESRKHVSDEIDRLSNRINEIDLDIRQKMRSLLSVEKTALESRKVEKSRILSEVRRELSERIPILLGNNTRKIQEICAGLGVADANPSPTLIDANHDLKELFACDADLKEKRHSLNVESDSLEMEIAFIDQAILDRCNKIDALRSVVAYHDLDLIEDTALDAFKFERNELVRQRSADELKAISIDERIQIKVHEIDAIIKKLTTTSAQADQYDSGIVEKENRMFNFQGSDFNGTGNASDETVDNSDETVF
jgi:hypothetical protein